MDLQETRDRLVMAALPHAALKGWTTGSLLAGAEDIGVTHGEALRAFPFGILGIIEHLFDYADRQMEEALAGQDLEKLRVRDRVTVAIRLRLELLSPHRDAVRRAMSHLAFPGNSVAGTACIWRTADMIWYAVGDTATDFSYYSKRGLLSAVLGATMLFWIKDESEGFEETWAFLDRQIQGVLELPRWGARLRETLFDLSCRMSAVAARSR